MLRSHGRTARNGAFLRNPPVIARCGCNAEPQPETAPALLINTQPGPELSQNSQIGDCQWTACTASGLNWSRKGKPDENRPEAERAAAFMYAAYALKKLLQRLRVEFPPRPPKNNKVKETDLDWVNCVYEVRESDVTS